MKWLWLVLIALCLSLPSASFAGQCANGGCSARPAAGDVQPVRSVGRAVLRVRPLRRAARVALAPVRLVKRAICH